MDFLAWHYSFATNFYLRRYRFLLRYITHFFSLPLLLPTLFAPWKRLIVIDKEPGFDLARYVQVATFNFVSRLVGATVRSILFTSGLIGFSLIAVLGLLGFVVWITFPVISFSLYQTYLKTPSNLARSVAFKIRTSQQDSLRSIFENEAGEFVLKRVGLSLAALLKNAKSQSFKLKNYSPDKYQEIIEEVLKEKLWDEKFFRKEELNSTDLWLAAKWWDKLREGESNLTENPPFAGMGIGRDLLFGYTPNLNKYSVDLAEPKSFSHHLIGRQNVVSRMERILTAGTSVIIIGPPGVGKRTVVLEFANKALQGLFGPEMAYRRVLELDYNFLISGSADVNQKKTLLSEIFQEAADAGNIILVLRDMHRLTNKDFEGFDFTDILESRVEEGNLKIIAISTERDYERFVSPNLRLRKLFETIEVKQPSKDEAMEILMESASRWESLKGLTITVSALRKILEGSDRYITEIPFPEKALELLDATVLFEEQKGEDKIITGNDVNLVLSEKTGISFARLTESEKKKLGNLEEIIHQRLVDQEVAVSLIAKILRGKITGAIKSDRPLGSFLFLGPTGVGKTETAKVLAKVYYESEEHILRFDMAEYAGREGLERLIGSVAKNQPGVLTTAIKNKPASLLLLDEIEKAPPDIYNLFLALLDEGVITDAFDRKIKGQHLFIVATTNAGAEYIRQLVKKGVTGDELQKKVTEYVLQKNIFSPEFLNRFDGVVVYEPLGKEHVLKIARILLAELCQNLKQKNIDLVIDESAVALLADKGYDPEFGARPMKRIIDVEIGDLIGRAMFKSESLSGSMVRLSGGNTFKLSSFS